MSSHVLCVQYAGISAINETVSGGGQPDCANCTGPSELYFPNYLCNDSPDWDNGTIVFQNPVPAGYSAQAINVTYYATFGCEGLNDSSAFVLLNKQVFLGFIPATSGKLQFERKSNIQQSY
jgi:hypothetical protein